MDHGFNVPGLPQYRRYRTYVPAHLTHPPQQGQGDAAST